MENRRLNTLLAAGCVAAFFAPLNADAEPVVINGTTESVTSSVDDITITGTVIIINGMFQWE